MKLRLGMAVLLLLNTRIVLASSDIWKLGEHFIEFQKDDTHGYLLSKSCEKKECDAKKALKKVSLKNLSSEKLSGGKNPGAVLCHEIPEAHVVYLRDLKGNDNSFCQFKDDSMASSSTLMMYARKNDEK